MYFTFIESIVGYMTICRDGYASKKAQSFELFGLYRANRHVSTIPTYRVYRLYDMYKCKTFSLKC